VIWARRNRSERSAYIWPAVGPGGTPCGGEVRDEVEVFTSLDGQAFTSRGRFDTKLWRKDIPLNHLLPDDETAQGWNFELRMSQPIKARYVRFVLQPHRIVSVSEIQALDFIRDDPFELRIALPDDS
jgi:hypothetical protein